MFASHRKDCRASWIFDIRSIQMLPHPLDLSNCNRKAKKLFLHTTSKVFLCRGLEKAFRISLPSASDRWAREGAQKFPCVLAMLFIEKNRKFVYSGKKLSTAAITPCLRVTLFLTLFTQQTTERTAGERGARKKKRKCASGNCGESGWVSSECFREPRAAGDFSSIFLRNKHRETETEKKFKLYINCEKKGAHTHFFVMFSQFRAGVEKVW